MILAQDNICRKSQNNYNLNRGNETLTKLTGYDQPTIAVITSLYCEKLAVDALIDDKTTFVKYQTEGNK
jgi:hypothetical protein